MELYECRGFRLSGFWGFRVLAFQGFRVPECGLWGFPGQAI